jgi:hypothetical protein
VKAGQQDYFAATDLDAAAGYPGYLPANAAAIEEGDLYDIGNPHNRRLKREWVAKYGPWPQTADGRNYHVAHIVATADGGPQTLENIRPMDPDEHMAEHKRNGDFRRFGARGPVAKREKAAAAQSATARTSPSSGPAPATRPGPTKAPTAKVPTRAGPAIVARAPAAPGRTPPAASAPAPRPVEAGDPAWQAVGRRGPPDEPDRPPLWPH